MLPASDRDTILATIKRGRYSLLLGAGFSASSASRTGERLPTTKELEEELARRFDLPQYPLNQLCGTIDPQKLSAYFESRFKNCKASDGISQLSRFVWASIYTFNIDDILADIYNHPHRQQHPEFRTFRHAFSPARDLSEINIIHLHGSVKFPAHGYVFSPEDYGNSAATDSTWFKIAADELSAQPFIVIGCSLAEPDLEYYLKRRTGVSPHDQQLAPSLYVTPELDAVKSKICERFGLIPIIASADDFFNTLLERCSKLPSPTELLVPAGSAALVGQAASDISLRTFFRQWTQVIPEELPERLASEPDRTLLSGTEPQWHHILRGDDILRQTERHLLSSAVQWHEDPSRRSRVKLITSTPGEGKSTALMRIGIELSRLGLEAYYYTARERLSPKHAAEVLSKLPGPAILLLDNLWEHGHQVDEFFELLSKKDKQALLIAAERAFRRRRITDALDKELVDHVALDPLEPSEALALVNKLQEFGLLGLNAGEPATQLAKQAENKGLFTAIVLLNGSAAHLDAFVEAELQALTDKDRAVYGILSLAHLCGHPLKLAYLQRAVNIPIGELSRSLLNEGGLRSLVVRLPPRGELWETRHRVLAEAVVRRLQPDERFQAFCQLAITLAPYVNRKTIVRGNTEAKIAGTLLDYDRTVKPMLGAAASDFYTTIKPHWSKVGRFWEQLALMKLEGDLYSALKFAEQAVGLERHFATLTTLAKIRFKAARAHAGTAYGLKHLKEGLVATNEAISNAIRSRRRDANSYDVGLRGLVDYYSILDARGAFAIDSDVRVAGDSILQRAQEIFRQNEQRELARRWAKLKQASAN